MSVVATRTGLTPHVIRVWEKRYGAVKPGRTSTNRRLYSDAEIERLKLLSQATQAGHSIGNIAQLPDATLAGLLPSAPQAAPAQESGGGLREDFVQQSLEAIRALNTVLFEEVLSRAIVALGQQGLLQRLVVPLVNRIGDLWLEGSITAAHEHFASAVLRTFLNRNSRPFASASELSAIVVATPSGQLHELGAVIAAAAANNVGWRVLYLGAGLPAADIAGAAVQAQARAVALSIVYPQDDPNLSGELESLKRFLPAGTAIVAGGRAAESYGDTLKRIGAVRVSDLRELYALLEELRRPAKAVKK